MVQPHEQFEGSFRRGLVLGLSLAEIFLILLFLLLLASMGLFTFTQEETQRFQEKNKTLEFEKQVLSDSLEELLGRNKTPEEFTRLVQDLQNQKKLKQLKEKAETKIKNLKTKYIFFL